VLPCSWLLNNLHKAWRHIKILGARTVIWLKPHSDDPQTLGVIVQNLVATTIWRPGSSHPCPVLNIFSALFNLNKFPWLSFFFKCFGTEVDTSCRDCYLAKLEKHTKNFRTACFWPTDSKWGHKSEISYLLPYSGITSSRASQLTVGIAMLMMWLIMNGHGRKSPWHLLRLRPCSPVIAQELNSHSGKRFLRNYSRWSCDTVQSGRNLLTHFKSFRRFIVSADPILCSSHHVAVHWLTDVLEELASL